MYERTDMNLHNWLTANNISTTDFAERLGVSYQAVWFWRKAKTYPSGKHLAQIETLTKGKVSARSWGEGANA